MQLEEDTSFLAFFVAPAELSVYSRTAVLQTPEMLSIQEAVEQQDWVSSIII